MSGTKNGNGSKSSGKPAKTSEAKKLQEAKAVTGVDKAGRYLLEPMTKHAYRCVLPVGEQTELAATCGDALQFLHEGDLSPRLQKFLYEKLKEKDEPSATIVIPIGKNKGLEIKAHDITKFKSGADRTMSIGVKVDF